MSSPRPAHISDGLLACVGRTVGPIRLPEKLQSDFIKEFNRKYDQIGLSVGQNPGWAVDSPMVLISSSDIESPQRIEPQPVREVLIGLFRGCLEEVFDFREQPKYMIDGRPRRGLFEQLSLTSSAAASVIHGGTSIANQVRHITYSMEVAARVMRGDRFVANWRGVWQISPVDSLQWDELQSHLREMHRMLRDTLAALDITRAECITAAIQAITQIAYHLAIIRQIVSM